MSNVISILHVSRPRYEEHAMQDPRDLTRGQLQYMARCARAYSETGHTRMARTLRLVADKLRDKQ